MKAQKVFLNELTTTSKNYKVKVKVIEKDRPQVSQVRKVPYQGLLLLDEKGNRMRGALFGDQLRSFKDAIVYNGTYEISNAPIKPMEDGWKKSKAELSYQMGFASNPIIQPMETETGPVLPNYLAIGQIPRSGDPFEKFDVLGIVLFVEEKPRQAMIGHGRTINVAEVVLMDHSTQQPLTVSTWDDLANIASETLVVKAERLDPVAFTALKVSTHKGFSMSTTMSSEIIQSPTGERVTALEKWSAGSAQSLLEMRSRVVHAKLLAHQKIVITIAALHAKRAQHTLQDDCFWLRVQIPAADFASLTAYLGCSKYGRSSKMPTETTYTCSLCKKTDCISTPRATFTCDLSDGTRTLNITAFTNHSEKLFCLPAQDIFRIKHSDDVAAFEVAAKIMRTTTYLVEVGPKNSLSISNILEWVVKQVVIEEDASGSLPAKSGPKTTNENNPSSQAMQSSIDLDTETSISQKLMLQRNAPMNLKDTQTPITATVVEEANPVDGVQLMGKSKGKDVVVPATAVKKVENKPIRALTSKD